MCDRNEETHKIPGQYQPSRYGELREVAGAPIGLAGRPVSAREVIVDRLSYHSPTLEMLPKFAAISQAAQNFALVVLENSPAGPDRNRIFQMIEDTRMRANLAIALEGHPDLF